MADAQRLICPSSALVDGGDGVRFEVPGVDRPQPAFVVRHRGGVHAFLNRCAHVPVELDWRPDKFFDLTGFYLICAVHGAHYELDQGRCVMGPCKGRSLTKLIVTEHDGNVFLRLDPDGRASLATTLRQKQEQGGTTSEVRSGCGSPLVNTAGDDPFVVAGQVAGDAQACAGPGLFE